MKPPKNYAEWSHCFDQFEKGEQDEELFDIMRNGKMPKGSVSERILRRWSSVIQNRVQKAGESFQHDLQQSMGQEHLLVPAIIKMRNQMRVIYELADLNVFPKEVRSAQRQAILEFLQKTQENLEKDAQEKDRSGRLASLIRNNPLTSIQQQPKEPGTKAEMKKGRRILF